MSRSLESHAWAGLAAGACAVGKDGEDIDDSDEDGTNGIFAKQI